MLGLVLVTMIGSIDVVPALSKDYKHDKGRYQHRGRGYDHNRYVYGRRDYRPYGYAPPPVIYAPPSPPGIGIFFPIHR